MRRQAPGVLSLLLSVLLAALLPVAGCVRRPQVLERRLNVGGREYRYRVWLPPHFSRRKRWPVVLFLHGSGERGDDNVRQLAVGLPAQLQRTPERFPFIVVIPQCPFNQEWYGEMETYALGALDASIREFRGDRSRITLTGISMGGAGVWYMAREKGRFAAIVPVCGEVVRAAGDPFPSPPPAELARVLASADPYAELSRLIGRTAVWAFHGADDTMISPLESRRMVNALHAQGNPARFTEYLGIGHDSWELAYAEKELPRWLLEQRLAPVRRGSRR
jgi:predicted peptidase